MIAGMSTGQRADMFIPAEDDPRENGPRLGTSGPRSRSICALSA
jgi:hypothetical protein